MPVIVDTNCFANVFSRKSERHAEFEPVLDWIVNGKGKLIAGGTKYKNELKKAPKYLKIFTLLRDAGKVHFGNDQEIDDYQKKVEELKEDDDFDDEHLPAIVSVTKCKIICSEDTRSIPHVTDRKYYPTGVSTPVYYTSSRNKDLLCDKYVDDSLKPINKIRKVYADNFLKVISD